MRRRPESVLVIVYTLPAEILLLQRKDDPNFWQSVTGALEEGETPLCAAHRELTEETGLVCEQLHDGQTTNRYPIHPNWLDRYAPGTTHNTEHVFLAEIGQAMTVTLSPEEHLAYRWLAVQDALALISSQTNRVAVENLVATRFSQ